MKVYQIGLLLAIGWAAGRMPHWFSEADAEKARLASSIGLPGESSAQATAPPPGFSSDAQVELAAEVAARVAAGVANETISRLIAAGWGPAQGAPARIQIEQIPGRPQQSIVRVITEQGATPARGLAEFAYDLPPGGRPDPVAQAMTTPAPIPPAAQPAGSDMAHKTASEGYAALKRGDLKEGVRLLQAAHAMNPYAPEAKSWEADVRQLKRRWSVASYAQLREGGAGDPLAASPVLGGGQSGAAVGYMLNPLDNARFSVIGRVTAASAANGSLDRETAEAALGLRLQPSRKIPIAIDLERRFALGLYSRNAWAARVSGGAQKDMKAFALPMRLEGYGEFGAVEGFTRKPDIYAGAQARGAAPLFSLGRVSMDAGAGSWAGVQRNYGVTASRVDVGPSARFRIDPWPFSAQFDYRVQAAGNALPGSGPVLTVAGEF